MEADMYLNDNRKPYGVIFPYRNGREFFLVVVPSEMREHHAQTAFGQALRRPRLPVAAPSNQF